jgi:hypothetical protein
MRAVHDEVVGPDVVRPARPQPQAGTVVEPEPASLGLLLGNLQPLAPPDTFDPLVVDQPTFGSKQCRDTAIAIATVPTGKTHDIGRQFGLVIARHQPSSLGRPGLAQISASPSLRQTVLLTNMGHTAPATLGA